MKWGWKHDAEPQETYEGLNQCGVASMCVSGQIYL